MKSLRVLAFLIGTVALFDTGDVVAEPYRFPLPAGSHTLDQWDAVVNKAKRKGSLISLIVVNRTVNGYGNNYCSVTSGRNRYKRKLFQMVADYKTVAEIVVIDSSVDNMEKLKSAGAVGKMLLEKEKLVGDLKLQMVSPEKLDQFLISFSYTDSRKERSKHLQKAQQIKTEHVKAVAGYFQED
jgi:hypothetical protein